VKIFLVCALTILMVSNVSSVFAQENNKLPESTGGQINEALGKIVPVRFLPTNPLYFSITLKEVVLRFFKPSAVKRAEYDFILTSKRIKESYYIYNNGDLRHLGRALGSYSKRVDITIGQIEKARSQNQELSMLADEIIDGLEMQEILLRYLRIREKETGTVLEMTAAVSSFEHLVNVIDNIKPGIKGRYKLLNVQDDILNESSASALPKPIEITETTKSAMPRRIIY